MSPIPPPHHDPTQRALVWDSLGWEARVFAWNDPRHAQLAEAGLLHLQLWCPTVGLSILTPSRLTGGRAEIWHDGKVLRATPFAAALQWAAQKAGAPLIDGRLVLDLMTRLVWMPYLGAAVHRIAMLPPTSSSGGAAKDGSTSDEADADAASS